MSTAGRVGCSKRALLDVVGARRPDEIVDVVLMVAVRGRPVAVVAAFTLDAGRAEDPSRGTVIRTS
jgi:hypothetical protein